MVNQDKLRQLMGDGKVGRIVIGLSALSQVGGWLCETDFTEHLFGSSGRGNPSAKLQAKLLASLGVLERETRGRATYYRVPPELYLAAQTHPKFDPGYHELELRFMRDGSRPVPKGAQL